MNKENHVKSLAALLLVVSFSAACRTVPMNPAPSASAGSMAVGATTPQGAVEMMLAAAQVQDIQAVAAAWGDEKGMTRDRIPRDELEKRALAMICVLRHDSQKIGDPQQLGGGRYQLAVDLKQGTSSGTTNFTVARSAAGRWLVTDFGMAALQNKGFCKRTGS
jgi:hypothetical protein